MYLQSESNGYIIELVSLKSLQDKTKVCDEGDVVGDADSFSKIRVMLIVYKVENEKLIYTFSSSGKKEREKE